ncbi:PH domain-containing protein [Nocardioides ultimimeridianus]
MTDWQRLDPRMLLVHPIKEVVRFLPVLFGIVVAGELTDGPWGLIGVGVPVALGVVRYLTTTYRITAGRVELRHGLLQRHSLSTPLDRVRTVDLTASPIHRILGLATLVIGTGSATKDDDDRITLDSLPRADAARLRTRLLGSAASNEDTTAAQHATVVASFSAHWLWYAPFTGTVLVAAAAVISASGPFLSSVHLHLSSDDVAFLSPAVVVALVLAGVLIVLPALFVAGYLVTNGGFLLSREGGAWHISRGLLTHHETSIDEARLAGVCLGEAAALRAARGRRLRAIVTGLGGRNQSGSTVLMPPTPRRTTLAAAAAVLGSEVPLTGALRPHGRRAATRRYTRALLGAAPVVLGIVVAIAGGAPLALGAVAVVVMAAALLLAADRARGLGHAHLAGHVVMRSGSIARHRSILGDGHIIGWTLRATWFQRRGDLVTVTATTAGGDGRIEVYDVPTADAVALARAATPGLLDEFLAG